MTNDSGCEVEGKFELIPTNFPVYVIKRKCEKEGLNYGSGEGGKPHKCEQKLTNVKFKDETDKMMTKSFQSGCVLRLL